MKQVYQRLALTNVRLDINLLQRKPIVTKVIGQQISRLEPGITSLSVLLSIRDTKACFK
jgi:hypothetical protein